MNRNPKEKPARIEIRTEPNKKKKITQLADKCNLPVSEYMVQRALGYEPRSVLPDALDDQQLLLVSSQLRDLLSGQGWDTTQGPGSAALPMSLLLLCKAGFTRQAKGLEIEMVTLHEAMTLLSVTVDREIVNRMLVRPDDAIGPELMQGLKELVLLAKRRP